MQETSFHNFVPDLSKVEGQEAKMSSSSQTGNKKFRGEDEAARAPIMLTIISLLKFILLKTRPQDIGYKAIQES